MYWFYGCSALPHGGYKYFHAASLGTFIGSLIHWQYNFQFLFTLGSLLQLHYAVDEVSFPLLKCG
jgi:hypothetical protein